MRLEMQKSGRANCWMLSPSRHADASPQKSRKSRSEELIAG
jgi:hypothetical protein